MKKRWLILPSIIGAILLCSATKIWLERNQETNSQERVQTVTYEESLTAAHQDEVIQLVTNFENEFFSLNSFINPEKVLPRIMSGPDVNIFIQMRMRNTRRLEVSRLTDFDIDGIRVFEYKPDSIIALACTKSSFISMSEVGITTDEEVTYPGKHLYFFRKDGPTWKVAYQTDITVQHRAIRDWENAAEEIQALTDDFYHLVNKDCIEL